MIWRGARPGKDGAGWLIQQGVGTIVNLELIHDDKPTFELATVPEATNSTVGYFRIHDWEPLPLVAPAVTDDHVAHFLAIVQQQPKPIYVHCRSGINRTGLMVAAYRILMEGVSENIALEEMVRYRGIWFEADAKYIRDLLPERRAQIRQKVKEWIPNLKKDAQISCAKGTCTVSED